MGRTGTTASAPALTASATRRKTSDGVSARAASWTSTMSASPAYFKANCTDSIRSCPPATAVIRIPEILDSESFAPDSAMESISLRARVKNSSGAATTIVEATPEEMIVSRLRARRLFPFSRTRAFGSALPKRVPDPAAGTMTQIFRTRALRPEWPRPRIPLSSQPMRVRKRGSDGPWTTCASHRSTGRGPARDARGHERLRQP